MATFTWTATTSGGLTAWETTAAWFNSANSSNPTAASFTTSPGNDYLINGSNLFTIDDIGGGGTAAPDIANSLTLSDVQATLLFASDGALDVTNTLSLSALLNLGTAVGGSVLSMGGSGGGGTISLASGGRLEGALGDSVEDVGTSPTKIIGSGTVIAEGGIFQIGSSVQVGVGDTTKFLIDPNATLAFADAVSGGTIMFTTASGTGVLEVSELSAFDATVKGLFVGTSKNDATSYIDFVNAGTDATASLTNLTSSGGTLNVASDTGSLSIPILGNYTSDFVNYVSDGKSGTNVFLTDTPCYAAGTAILTPDGEVAVETIQAGDVVMTSANGTLEPQTVIWAGSREIDLTKHPSPETVAPIRFRRGALGFDLPRRDMLLSPDHCLFIDRALFPAKLLINGMTIVRDLSLPTVCYHHIELDRHAVLLAEGVEAESYLDTGNRAYFSNAGTAMILHPEFSINEHLRCWETDACAPLMVRPEVVKPVWDRFAARAIALGFAAPVHATTTDAAIRLVVDGKTMLPLAARGRTISFVVPEGAGSVRLVSRSVNPGELRPWLDDPRRLGVAVRSMVLRDRTGETVCDADHPALTDGWHAVEHATDGSAWRWSGGDASLPIVSDGPCVLEVTLSETTTYLESTERLAA
jgi:Hint domain